MGNEDRRSKIKQLNKDLSEQQLKLDRVQKQLGKYTREVRSRQGRNSPLMEETDMEVREMREKNRQLCKSVAAVVQQYPDIANTMNIYFQQAGIPSFESSSSRSSSTTSSRRSTPRSTPRSNQSTARSQTSVGTAKIDISLDISSSRKSPRSLNNSRAPTARSKSSK